MAGILSILAGAIGATPPPAFTGATGGNLYAWGLNNHGQLGLGNTTYYSSPKQVGSLTNWSKINRAHYHTMAVKSDGTLWSWGWNGRGQLGLGNRTNYSSPKQVGSLTNWLNVAGGVYHSIGIKTDGTLWSWGSNNSYDSGISGIYGQLGLNNSNAYSSPKQVGALTNWLSISSGTYHNTCIKTDGTLWTWGWNAAGQLGLGNTTNYSSPKQVGSLTNWLKVSSGYSHTTSIKTDGTLWVWGVNNLGQLGLGNTTQYNSPKQVGALTNWSTISASIHHSGAIKTDGTLWTWGRNNYGQLGLNDTTNRSSPVQVGALTNWLSISAGQYTASSIKTDGTLWAWGFNGHGNLGLGNTTNYSSPKQVGSLTNWGSLPSNSCGGYQSIALTAPTKTVPDKPTNVAATAGDSSATVTFTAPSNGGSAITGYTVTVYSGSTVVGTVSGVSTTINVTGLVNGTTYTFTVKATNAIGTGLESTGNAPSIGSSTQGGYYAGQVVDGGVTYALIVAPKASGANGGATIQWKTTNDAAPASTQTLTNGVAASNAMNASNYPAAFYCKGLNIGGFTDWYLPARDELEILYRNLKPGTTSNYVANPWRTTANFGTGFGLDNGANGYNANSSPVGSGYTASSPVQTGVAVFKTGGTESFVENYYWSSTEYSSTNAWFQPFNDGVQYLLNKTSLNSVRAIRRVLPSVISSFPSATPTPQTFVDDVFSTYLYTGTGANQTINNGIDLAGKGGLVWLKNRGFVSNHSLQDTTRPASYQLSSNSTAAQSTTLGDLTSFNNNGFSLGTSGGGNNITGNVASWTFRKAAKFFDVVTYTGNGVAGRQIPHNLGVDPGMIIVKSTDNPQTWCVYHRSTGNNKRLVLSSTMAADVQSIWNNTNPTATNFTLGSAYDVNGNGANFVAYLFAHDTSSTGIIQCGSFTTDASGNATVNLGWEPQFVLAKSSDSPTDWYIYDSMRGFTYDSTENLIFPNRSDAERTDLAYIRPRSTGFYAPTTNPSKTYIYMAIRRPNKPPTTGTQVYNAISRTGTGVNTTISSVGFAPDAVFVKAKQDQSTWMNNKLVGQTKWLTANATGADITDSNVNSLTSYLNTGISVGTDSSLGCINYDTSKDYINWFFKRALGFFDVVCYTGNGSTQNVNHNLTVIPELMIVKDRTSGAWCVYSAPTGNSSLLQLQTTGAVETGAPQWNSTTPTSSVFSLGNSSSANTNGHAYVAYLFATLAGISKVGSYTGNGGTQAINCGFTSGARFVMVKCTSATGDWIIADSARGINANQDPLLKLNSTAAEVTTDDWIDADTSGFVVNQTSAANANVSGATYIFLAIS